jgi:peroxiredoxin
MVKVGEVAPDFSLFNHENQKVSLSQFKGTKVVLLFFPFANTGVCTKELCTFRDSMTQYNDLDAQVLALSVDSPFSLKLWHDKNGFTFPLLSDFNKEVIKQYGAIYDVFAPGAFNYFGVAKRSAFVIDKEGILRYVEVLEDAKNEPNYEEIQKVLASL